ncbi:hypothetical protein FACS1894186_3990 [Alphaproteobacteria bacterium]|nr:hypothetical protein FACS1894186_3990 [Alphaproteobacteria bacterium]
MTKWKEAPNLSVMRQSALIFALTAFLSACTGRLGTRGFWEPLRPEAYVYTKAGNFLTPTVRTSSLGSFYATSISWMPAYYPGFGSGAPLEFGLAVDGYAASLATSRGELFVFDIYGRSAGLSMWRDSADDSGFLLLAGEAAGLRHAEFGYWTGGRGSSAYIAPLSLAIPPETARPAGLVGNYSGPIVGAALSAVGELARLDGTIFLTANFASATVAARADMALTSESTGRLAMGAASGILHMEPGGGSGFSGLLQTEAAFAAPVASRFSVPANTPVEARGAFAGGGWSEAVGQLQISAPSASFGAAFGAKLAD